MIHGGRAVRNNIPHFQKAFAILTVLYPQYERGLQKTFSMAGKGGLSLSICENPRSVSTDDGRGRIGADRLKRLAVPSGFFHQVVREEKSVRQNYDRTADFPPFLSTPVVQEMPEKRPAAKTARLPFPLTCRGSALQGRQRPPRRSPCSSCAAGGFRCFGNYWAVRWRRTNRLYIGGYRPVFPLCGMKGAAFASAGFPGVDHVPAAAYCGLFRPLVLHKMCRFGTAGAALPHAFFPELFPCRPPFFPKRIGYFAGMDLKNLRIFVYNVNRKFFKKAMPWSLSIVRFGK